MYHLLPFLNPDLIIILLLCR